MPEPELSDEETKILLRKRIETTTKRVAMLAFSDGQSSSPESVDNNGTVSLLELPKGKFLITNFHVWDEFRNRRTTDKNCKVGLTGEGLVRPIDISDASVVSESQELDLCVLSYPPERIEAIGKEFFRPLNWPPTRMSEGEDVCFTGFPGVRRSVEEIQHPHINESISVLWHESVILWMHAEGISDRKVRMRFTNPNPETIQLSKKEIGEYRWGGMSGSLVYRKDSALSRFVPCGILHAAGNGKNATFFATHLDFIHDDGTIIVS